MIRMHQKKVVHLGSHSYRIQRAKWCHRKRKIHKNVTKKNPNIWTYLTDYYDCYLRLLFLDQPHNSSCGHILHNNRGWTHMKTERAECVFWNTLQKRNTICRIFATKIMVARTIVLCQRDGDNSTKKEEKNNTAPVAVAVVAADMWKFIAFIVCERSKTHISDIPWARHNRYYFIIKLHAMCW